MGGIIIGYFKLEWMATFINIVINIYNHILKIFFVLHQKNIHALNPQGITANNHMEVFQQVLMQKIVSESSHFFENIMMITLWIGVMKNFDGL